MKTTEKTSQNIAEPITIINTQTTLFKTSLTIIFVQAMKCLLYINSVNIWKFGSRELRKTRQNSPVKLLNYNRNGSCHFKALLQNNVCIYFHLSESPAACNRWLHNLLYKREKAAPTFWSSFIWKDDAIRVHLQSSTAGSQNFLGRAGLLPRPRYVPVSKLEAFNEK